MHSKRTVLTVAIAGLSILAGHPTPAASIGWLTNNVSGRWEDAAKWNGGVVPGFAALNDDARTVHAGLFAITLDNATLAAPDPDLTALTLKTLTLNVTNTDVRLNVSGTSSQRFALKLHGNTGATGLSTLVTQRGTLLDLSYVDLSVDSASNAWVIYAHGINPAQPSVYSIRASNSTITVNEPSNYAVLLGGSSDRGGVIRFENNSSLSVLNTTNNAIIQVGGNITASDAQPTRLEVADSTLTGNVLTVRRSGHFLFSGGTAAASSVTGNINLGEGGVPPTDALTRAQFQSGTFNVGGDISLAGSNGPLHVLVEGGLLNVTGNVRANNSGSSHAAGQPFLFHVSGGTLAAPNVLLGTTKDNLRGDCELRISGSGTVLLGTMLDLGNDRGPGLLQMSDGFLAAPQIKVGGPHDANRKREGYYVQTGGTSVVSDKLLLYRTTGTGGAREFRVADDATMVFTGAGFATTGNGSGAYVIPAQNWDTSGTLRFAPLSVTTQTLLALGQDVGSGIAIASMLAGNHGVGTLDLTAIDGDEKLIVAAAGNHAANALYVNNLIGLDLTTNSPTLKHLDSALNIYYNANLNSYLMGATYDLVAGGQLLGFWVPEPGSLALLAFGTLALAGHRRKRSA